MDLRLKRCSVLLKRYAGKKYRDILFSGEQIFTVEESYYKQNDEVYAHSSEEASNRIPRVQRGHFPSSLMVWLGVSYWGLTEIHLYVISWISPIEVSSEYRVCEECFVILQIQAQMDEPCRNYGHRSVCLGCGVSVLRARSIPMGSNCHECTVIKAWVPQIQADLAIFTRVCRPCWRRANRAQATSTASSQQELDQIMPIFVDFYIAGAIINHFHPFLWDRTNAREMLLKH
ncbi:hypothetical protein evm_014249 [Chilo suppressalis]|nr:hypothetical protein evm_014249 [Chilo suppressalis]